MELHRKQNYGVENAKGICSREEGNPGIHLEKLPRDSLLCNQADLLDDYLYADAQSSNTKLNADFTSSKNMKQVLSSGYCNSDIEDNSPIYVPDGLYESSEDQCIVPAKNKSISPVYLPCSLVNLQSGCDDANSLRYISDTSNIPRCTMGDGSLIAEKKYENGECSEINPRLCNISSSSMHSEISVSVATGSDLFPSKFVSNNLNIASPITKASLHILESSLQSLDSSTNPCVALLKDAASTPSCQTLQVGCSDDVKNTSDDSIDIIEPVPTVKIPEVITLIDDSSSESENCNPCTSRHDNMTWHSRFKGKVAEKMLRIRSGRSHRLSSLNKNSHSNGRHSTDFYGSVKKSRHKKHKKTSSSSFRDSKYINSVVKSPQVKKLPDKFTQQEKSSYLHTLESKLPPGSIGELLMKNHTPHFLKKICTGSKSAASAEATASKLASASNSDEEELLLRKVALVSVVEGLDKRQKNTETAELHDGKDGNCPPDLDVNKCDYKMDSSDLLNQIMSSADENKDPVDMDICESDQDEENDLFEIGDNFTIPIEWAYMIPPPAAHCSNDIVNFENFSLKQNLCKQTMESSYAENFTHIGLQNSSQEQTSVFKLHSQYSNINSTLNQSSMHQISDVSYNGFENSVSSLHGFQAIHLSVDQILPDNGVPHHNYAQTLTLANAVNQEAFMDAVTQRRSNECNLIHVKIDKSATSKKPSKRTRRQRKRSASTNIYYKVDNNKPSDVNIAMPSDISGKVYQPTLGSSVSSVDSNADEDEHSLRTRLLQDMLTKSTSVSILEPKIVLTHKTLFPSAQLEHKFSAVQSYGSTKANLCDSMATSRQYLSSAQTDVSYKDESNISSESFDSQGDQAGKLKFKYPKPIIINLNEDSDSEGSQEEENSPKMGMQIDHFIKDMRKNRNDGCNVDPLKSPENSVTSKVMLHLSRPAQMEYRRMKLRLHQINQAKKKRVAQRLKQREQELLAEQSAASDFCNESSQSTDTTNSPNPERTASSVECSNDQEELQLPLKMQLQGLSETELLQKSESFVWQTRDAELVKADLTLQNKTIENKGYTMSEIDPPQDNETEFIQVSDEKKVQQRCEVEIHQACEPQLHQTSETELLQALETQKQKTMQNEFQANETELQETSEPNLLLTTETDLDETIETESEQNSAKLPGRVPMNETDMDMQMGHKQGRSTEVKVLLGSETEFQIPSEQGIRQSSNAAFQRAGDVVPLKESDVETTSEDDLRHVLLNRRLQNRLKQSKDFVQVNSEVLSNIDDLRDILRNGIHVDVGASEWNCNEKSSMFEQVAKLSPSPYNSDAQDSISGVVESYIREVRNRCGQPSQVCTNTVCTADAAAADAAAGALSGSSASDSDSDISSTSSSSTSTSGHNVEQNDCSVTPVCVSVEDSSHLSDFAKQGLNCDNEVLNESLKSMSNSSSDNDSSDESDTSHCSDRTMDTLLLKGNSSKLGLSDTLQDIYNEKSNSVVHISDSKEPQICDAICEHKCSTENIESQSGTPNKVEETLSSSTKALDNLLETLKFVIQEKTTTYGPNVSNPGNGIKNEYQNETKEKQPLCQDDNSVGGTNALNEQKLKETDQLTHDTTDIVSEDLKNKSPDDHASDYHVVRLDVSSELKQSEEVMPATGCTEPESFDSVKKCNSSNDELPKILVKVNEGEMTGVNVASVASSSDQVQLSHLIKPVNSTKTKDESSDDSVVTHAGSRSTDCDGVAREREPASASSAQQSAKLAMLSKYERMYLGRRANLENLIREVYKHCTIATNAEYYCHKEYQSIEKLRKQLASMEALYKIKYAKQQQCRDALKQLQTQQIADAATLTKLQKKTEELGKQVKGAEYSIPSTLSECDYSGSSLLAQSFSKSQPLETLAKASCTKMWSKHRKTWTNSAFKLQNPFPDARQSSSFFLNRNKREQLMKSPVNFSHNSKNSDVTKERQPDALPSSTISNSIKNDTVTSLLPKSLDLVPLHNSLANIPSSSLKLCIDQNSSSKPLASHTRMESELRNRLIQKHLNKQLDKGHLPVEDKKVSMDVSKQNALCPFDLLGTCNDEKCPLEHVTCNFSNDDKDSQVKKSDGDDDASKKPLKLLAECMDICIQNEPIQHERRCKVPQNPATGKRGSDEASEQESKRLKISTDYFKSMSLSERVDCVIDGGSDDISSKRENISCLTVAGAYCQDTERLEDCCNLSHSDAKTDLGVKETESDEDEDSCSDSDSDSSSSDSDSDSSLSDDSSPIKSLPNSPCSHKGTTASVVIPDTLICNDIPVRSNLHTCRANSCPPFSTFPVRRENCTDQAFSLEFLNLMSDKPIKKVYFTQFEPFCAKKGVNES